MKILTSYSLSVALCIMVSLSILLLIVIQHFSVIVETNIEKISSLEKSTSFRTLEEKITNINLRAQEYNIQPFSKSEAVDIIIKYADYLLTTYDAKAETDRPEDDGSILRLKVNFDMRFGSPQEFLSSVGGMLKMTVPILQINSMIFNQESVNASKLTYKIAVTAVIIQPYTNGDAKNEQR